MAASVGNRVLVLFCSEDAQHDNVLRDLYAAAGHAAPEVLEDVMPLTLDNKYYTATIHLHLVRDAHEVELDLVQDLLTGAEGLVLVMPKSGTALTTARRLGVAASDLAVSLCVGVGSGATFSSDFESFCLDSGIELIDADERDMSMEAFGRELTAMDRVVEALSTHAWSGMRRKTRAEAQRSHVALEDAPTPPAADDDDDAADISPDELEGREEEPEPTLEQRIGAFEIKGDDDDDDNDDLQEFDRAFAAIQNMRAMSRDLSDTDRRRMAADIAMSLWNQLGSDDEEGDDDEDYEDDE